MRVFCVISMLCFSICVKARNAGDTDLPTENKCQSLIEYEIDKGAASFSINMINRMVDILIQQKKFESREKAERCVKFQLMQNRIPFEE